MSARVLAHISESEPWGVTDDEPVFCSYCKEQIEHNGEQWTHIRTGLSADWRSKECHPPCRDCDKEGLIAIGADQFVGSGIRFVIDHFACREHAHGVFERT